MESTQTGSRLLCTFSKMEKVFGTCQESSGLESRGLCKSYIWICSTISRTCLLDGTRILRRLERATNLADFLSTRTQIVESQSLMILCKRWSRLTKWARCLEHSSQLYSQKSSSKLEILRAARDKTTLSLKCPINLRSKIILLTDKIATSVRVQAASKAAHYLSMRTRQSLTCFTKLELKITLVSIIAREARATSYWILCGMPTSNLPCKGIYPVFKEKQTELRHMINQRSQARSMSQSMIALKSSRSRRS